MVFVSVVGEYIGPVCTKMPNTVGHVKVLRSHARFERIVACFEYVLLLVKQLLLLDGTREGYSWTACPRTSKLFERNAI